MLRSHSFAPLVQRVSVPIGMWRPWSAESIAADPLAGGVGLVAGRRVVYSICYEQLRVFSVLVSLVHPPDVLVGARDKHSCDSRAGAGCLGSPVWPAGSARHEHLSGRSIKRWFFLTVSGIGDDPTRYTSSLLLLTPIFLRLDTGYKKGRVFVTGRTIALALKQ